ncbi:hypothetical protein F2Q68_00023595 [Brassica cretica]|nr:hypothetical protein F2Q68_00023595 [Brassica cretica]
MIDEIESTEEEDEIQNDVDGVFVSGRSSFIITDDLKVSVDSTGLVLKTLNSLGCSDVSNLGEQLLDIGLNEKQSTQDMTNMHKLPTPCLETKTDVSESEFTIDAIVRKQDMKILYVECGEDFVDLLFSFLAVPLEYVCDTSSGCIGNLRRSFKDLTVVDKEGKEGIPIHASLTTDYDRTPLYRKDRIVPVTVIDPKSHGRDQSENGSGFVKRGTRFTVSDDVIITTRGCLSTSICFLKKYEIKADDVDVQVIRIREAEVMNVLRASLGTTSALNTALWNLIAKKPKMET